MVGPAHGPDVAVGDSARQPREEGQPVVRLDHTEAVAEAQVDRAVGPDDAPQLTEQLLGVDHMLVDVVADDDVGTACPQREPLRVRRHEPHPVAEGGVRLGQAGPVDVQADDIGPEGSQLVGDDPARAADVDDAQSMEILSTQEVLEDARDLAGLSAAARLVEHQRLQVGVRQLRRALLRHCGSLLGGRSASTGGVARGGGRRPLADDAEGTDPVTRDGEEPAGHGEGQGRGPAHRRCEHQHEGGLPCTGSRRRDHDEEAGDPSGGVRADAQDEGVIRLTTEVLEQEPDLHAHGGPHHQ